EQTAIARLQPTPGNNVLGRLRFTSINDAVRGEGEITGLPPGSHGFHVHEFGDCSAPDASSAGGHCNPTGQHHGPPDDSLRHGGDLGNIDAGQDSTASVNIADSILALSGPNSIGGKAVVVHADADDLESQPSRNAGARLACGVIETEMRGMGMPR